MQIIQYSVLMSCQFSDWDDDSLLPHVVDVMINVLTFQLNVEADVLLCGKFYHNFFLVGQAEHPSLWSSSINTTVLDYV
jgi:hypothetical protein